MLNFNIAVNDRYKPAGSSEYKEVATFINCSYWIGIKAGQWVKKGAVVLLNGRLGMHVYINSDGNPLGSIDFHVNSMSIIAFAKRNGSGNTDSEDAGRVKKGRKGDSSEKGKGKTSDEVPF
ncbi:single-stranded DNA-binding protein [Flavobacterium hungaricum]|uniref:single-stranded DNA-binding protein n=1 Tax=Flavobacterium hungaricum TaxID=2082725 RepID=UPI00188387D3